MVKPGPYNLNWKLPELIHLFEQVPANKVFVSVNRRH